MIAHILPRINFVMFSILAATYAASDMWAISICLALVASGNACLAWGLK